jgi:predicted nucleotidyltransferase component of viral defense system
MRQLQDLEILEIDVLELLNSIKVLDSLYFGGGTMLRLCHNLNRYSTDMDFWLDTSADLETLYKKIKDALSSKYRIRDAANKNFTMLFEFKAPDFLRNLKIEIRKEQKDFDWERKIAFSRFTNKQVVVKGLTLSQMMKNKIEALLSRKIIRDCFDLEFLVMRGTELPKDEKKLRQILEIILGFNERDYKVTLGSILEENDRKLYLENKFAFLKEEINRILNLPYS